MSSPESTKELPDLAQGIAASTLASGAPFSGRIGDDAVIIVKHGENYSAVSANCTHYSGPLAEGLVVGDTVRCPWHHACFDLRTGEALRAPALDPLSCWRVEVVNDVVFVREKLEPQPPKSIESATASIVIVGGGGAGMAAAEMLRRDGYNGRLVMISADSNPPIDRPNLSKDFLAGTAPEDWMPMRSAEYFADNNIELLLNTTVTSVEPTTKTVHCDNGESYSYDKLLIATGAEPIHLDIPGADPSQVFYLRSFADSKAIVARAATANTVVVIGASFIGLEVAASLRTLGKAVHVVAPETRPLEKILGKEIGEHIQLVHESHDVVFHLGNTVARVNNTKVVLSDNTEINADFVVVGVGVRPLTSVAENCGAKVERGVLVNEFMETSVPDVYAAGDIARWHDMHSGTTMRVEHWVVAERQGQAAAKNMLGMNVPYESVPFFWSQHFDVVINYVGHAEGWNSITIDGSLNDNDCTVTYVKNNTVAAVATIYRDMQSLEAELNLEHQSVE